MLQKETIKFYCNKWIIVVLTAVVTTANAQVQLDATGAANNFSVTYPANMGASVSSGLEFTFRANHSITGPATLNVNTTGARPILKNFNKSLVANDIITGQFVRVIYDNSSGGQWQMLSNEATPQGNLSGIGTIGAIPFYSGTNILNADAANFLWDNINKRIGIGTNSPQRAIHVIDNLPVLRLERSINNSQHASVDFAPFGAFAPSNPLWSTGMKGGSVNYVIQTYDGSVNSDRFTILTNGNLGVGTSNPSGNLHVRGAVDGNIFIQRGTNTAVADMVFTNATGTLDASQWQYGLRPLGENNIFALANYPGGTYTQRWVVLGSGEVGVGTSTPNQRLSVAGNISTSGTAFMQNAQINALVNGVLSVNGTGQVVLAPAGASLSGSGTNGAVNFWTGTNTQSADATNFIWDNTNKRLGIGTATPASRLVVSNTIASGGMLKLENPSNNAGDTWWIGFDHGAGSGDANDRARIGAIMAAGGAGRLFFSTGIGGSQVERVRIDENGNVGIGTSAPNFNLEVNTNNGTPAQIGLTNTNASGDARLELRTNSTIGAQYIEFTTGSTGVNTPDYTNRIYSNQTFLAFERAAGTTMYIENSTGNVGINNNAPNQRLSVGGNISTSGTAFMQNAQINALANGVLSVNGTGQVVLAPGGGISGSGSNGAVPFFTGTNTQSADATNFFWDNTNKRLGIGTNAPGTILHLVSQATTGDFIQLRAPNMAPGNITVFSQGLGPTFANQAEYRFTFVANGSLQNAHSFGFNAIQPFVHFTAAERVGIGVAVPNERLVVVGNTSVTGNSTISGTSVSANTRITSLSNGVLSVNGTGNVVTTSITPSQWGNNTANIITFGGITVNNNPSGPSIIVADNQTSNARQMMLNYNVSTNFGEIVVIQQGIGFRSLILGEAAASNIGIGSNSPPLSKLSLTGGMAIGTYATTNAAPANGLIISGQVGIGTSSPTAGFGLEVNEKAIFRPTTGTWTDGVILITPSNQGKAVIWHNGTGTPSASTGAYFVGTVGSDPWFHLIGNGLTTSPLQNSNDIASLNTINGGTFAIASRLGIGTPNPNTNLHVIGNSTVTGTAMMQNAQIASLTNGVLSVNGTGNVVLAPALGDNLGNHIATQQIVGVGGSTGAPSYSFSGNLGTGMFLENINILGFATGGNLRMRLDGFGDAAIARNLSLGNLAINSAYRLQITDGISILTSTTPTPAELRFEEGTNTAGDHYTSFRAGDQAQNINYTLPVSMPTAGQVLSSDASGNMTWVNSPLGTGANGAVNFWTGTNTQSADAANFFWDNSTKRLGVGTNTPNATLTLARGSGTDGTAAFFGTTHVSYFNYQTAEDTYLRGGKTGSKIWINDSHTGDVILVNGGGKVGIGKSNPDRRLDVASDGTNWMSGVFAGQDGTDKIVIGNLSGSATIGAHNAALSAWANMVMQRNGGNLAIGNTTPINKLDLVGNMAIGAYAGVNTAPGNGLIVSGNVGFGTTAPNAKLDIVGAFMISNAFNNNTPRPAISASRISGEISAYGSAGASGDDGFLRLSAGGGTTVVEKSYIELSGYSQLADMNKNIVFGVNGVERMRIVNGGNVGIGTSSPGSLLHVRGTSPYIAVDAAATNQQSSIVFAELGATRWQIGKQTDNSFFIYDQINSRDALRVTNTGNIILAPTVGNVGIGTNAPQNMVHLLNGSQNIESNSTDAFARNISFIKSRNNATVVDNDELGFVQFLGHDGTAGRRAAYIMASADGAPIAGVTPGRISFFTSQVGLPDQLRMVIKNNGNVGIGTGAPGALLAIANGANDPTAYGRGLQITNLSGNRQQMAFIRNGFNVLAAGWNGANQQWGFGIGQITDANFVPSFLSIDAFNGNVGIGTSTPNLSTLQVERQGSWVEISSFVYANGANNNATITTGRANGTQAAPVALLNNDILGYYYFKGHNGTSFAVGAEIRASATENFSAINSGTKITFATKQNGGGAFNDRMVIDHNGNVGIGITTPSLPLHVSTNVAATNLMALANTANNGYSAISYRDNTNVEQLAIGYGNPGAPIYANQTYMASQVPIIFSLLGTERMRITTGGVVAIGTPAPGPYGLHVANGAVAGNGAYVNLSDKRLKKNIIPIYNATALIKLLQGVHFDWDTTKAKNLDFEGPHQPGFIAQEVMKIIPEAVSYDKVNDRYSVAYSKVIPFLVEAIKEQQKLIEKLQSENSERNIQNAKLQEQSASMQLEIDAIKRHLGLDVKSEK